MSVYLIGSSNLTSKSYGKTFFRSSTITFNWPVYTPTAKNETPRRRRNAPIILRCCVSIFHLHHVFLQSIFNVFLGNASDNAFHFLPVLHNKQRGNAENLKAFSFLRILIYVKLPNEHFSGVFPVQLLNRRRQSSARTTPRSPEID